MQNAVGLVGCEWVANKAGGFVDDDDVRVFVQNRQWRIAGLEPGAKPDVNGLASGETIASREPRAGRPSSDATGLTQATHHRPRQRRPLGNDCVEAAISLVGGDDDRDVRSSLGWGPVHGSGSVTIDAIDAVDAI